MSLIGNGEIRRGREIDEQVALLLGEASHQEVEDIADTPPVPVWHEVPSRPDPREAGYYSLPMMKEPVWVWTVPLYFYVGGAAGGAGVLGAVLEVKRKAPQLVRKCRWLAFAGATLSAGLLTYDLGKPLRFLNMLRVVRPTSPMSLGSWGLAETGGLAGAATIFGEMQGAAGKTARLATMALATHGTFLAGYTGVLLSNSATPLWKRCRWTLPLLFAASGLASAAALLELFPLQGDEEAIVRRYTIVGKVAEAASIKALELEAATTPEVVRPLYSGKSGILWGTAKACLAAGIVTTLLPARNLAKRRVAATLTTVGSILLRYALMQAGKQSALDPRATIEPQRRGEEQLRRSSLPA